MQSQSPNRIQFKYSPNKVNIVSTPPVQRVVVVEQAHVSASPIKRVQASVDKQQIAETIYTKLQQINSKLYRMTQLELQNQVLKSQNERLAKNTPQNGTVQINEDQRQKEQAKQQININEMKKLQEQNAELKLKLEKYEKRLSQGRQIFSRILKDQSMKQKAQIDEMREIFDD